MYRNQPRGEKQYCAKLNEEIVLEIRERYIKSHPTRGACALARKHDVNQSTVHRIIHRDIWKHI